MDHRQSFLKKTLGVSPDLATPDDWQEVKNLKKIIFEGYVKALETGLSRDENIFFIDDETGEDIIEQAELLKLKYCLAVEKSGCDLVELEKAEGFVQEIEKYRPEFVKLLVRYSPKDSREEKEKQVAVIVNLSNYLKKNKYKFILEIRIRNTETEGEGQVGELNDSDFLMRPELEIGAVSELRGFGVDPDVWHMEGLESVGEYEKLVEEIQKNQRLNTGLVIMSRGSALPKVEKWLGAGVNVRGVLGFSVGRSVFQNAIRQFKEGGKSREDCIDQIAKNYLEFNFLFNRLKK